MEEKYLSKEELLRVACNFIVAHYLAKNGFELGSGFPRKEYPNIVCRKDGITYGIVVIPSVYPDYEVMTDIFRKKTVEVCKENNSVALFAPVGLRSKYADEVEKKVINRKLEANVFFPGFIKLNDEDTFNFSLKNDEYFRP